MARGIYTLLVVFVMLLAVPSVPAQPKPASAAPDNTVTIGDAAGDVAATVAPKQNPAPQNASCPAGNCQTYFDYIDITKIVFGHETEEGFKVELSVKSTVNSMPASTSQAQRWVSFAYGRLNWRITPGSTCQGGGGGPGGGGGGGTPSTTSACLSAMSIRAFKAIPMQVDATTHTYTFTLEKKFLFNENRVPARFGDSLTNITAQGSYAIVRACPQCPGGDPTGGVTAYDRAPNGIEFGAPFTFNQGSNGQGYLALTSTEPIRVSNGEATTIVYKVDVTNQHSEDISVQLAPEEVEDGWTVRVPSLLRVPAESTVTFPVILALPFTHDHGRTALFKVKAQSVQDSDSWAELDLGVFWTDVPQPSAHHEGAGGGTYFHSAPAEDDFLDQLEPVAPRLQGWMNSVDQDPDPNAKDANIPAFFNEGMGCLFFQVQSCKVPPETRYSWFFPLSPGLLLGLDFDTSRPGLITFPITAKVQATVARVVVDLVYCEPSVPSGGGGGGGGQGGSGGGTCGNNSASYRRVLAHGEQTRALAQGVPTQFEIPLNVDVTADLLPYKRGANIGIRIVLTTDTPQNAVGSGPEFGTNAAHLELPLIEYHDPVDQAFQNVGTLALVSKSDFEKRANPGRTSVFDFEVKSNATKDQDVALEVEGVNRDWVRLVGESRFELGPGEARAFQIVVEVPPDAAPEERAELFVVAQNLDDSTVVAVTRLRTTVVDPSVEEIPDESGKAKDASADEGAPGLGLVMALGVVAVVAALRRRK